MNAKILPILLLSFTSMCAIEINKWKEIPRGGITQDITGNFNYAYGDRDILTEGLFFLNPKASLKLNFNISGNNWPTTQCGILFCAIKEANLTFNTGNIQFNIHSNATTAQGTSPFTLFRLQNRTSLDIAANFSLQISQESLFDSVFFLTDALLNVENADLKIDISQNASRGLFKALGKSDIFINQGGEQDQRIIQLGGNVLIQENSFLRLYLGNSQSYFQGNITLSDNGHTEMILNHSNAYVNFTQESNISSVLRLFDSNFYGSATTPSGMRSLNVELHQSQWKIFDSSSIADLVLDHSELNFMFDTFGFRLGKAHTQKTLQANTLSGDGHLTLYADVLSKTIDTTTFNTASGTHSVLVFYNPTTFTQALAQSITQDDKMVVATITNDTPKANEAVFVGEEVELGILSYKTNLSKITDAGRTQWVISSIVPNQESTTAKLLTTALNTPYRITALFSQTLNQRLGDLRDYPKSKDYGLYFRYLIGQNALSSSSNTLQTKDFYMDFSLGLDSNILSKIATTFFGASLDVLLFDSKNPFYLNQTLGVSPALYVTGIFHNGFYYDALLRYIYTDGNFDIISPNINARSPLSSHSLILSGELGWKLKFGNKSNYFFLEPQSKLDVGAIFTSAMKLKDIYQENIQAKTEVQVPLLNKTSLLVGYGYNLENLKGDVKIGPFLTYALQSGANTILQDLRSQITKKFKSDFDVGLSLASNLTLQDYLRFYLELDSSFLGQYRQDFAFNIGLRWTFGDRYIPPPPPPTDPKRFIIRYKNPGVRRTLKEVQNNDVGNMKHYDNQGEIKRSYFYPKPQTLKK